MRAKEYLKKKKSLSKTGNYKHPISTSKGITTRDRWDCTRCDVVLVNLLGTREISIGTVMEIAWADSARIPIVLVMEDKNPHDHLILSQVAGFRVDNLEDGLDIVKALLL
jgi:nucleoside 2-deoxyribosyltransferase